MSALRSFFLSHGDAGTTNVKLVAGEESYRVRLPGIPAKFTVDGIAAHAASVPDKIKVGADKVEMGNGSIVATPTKGMLGKDVSSMIQLAASVAAPAPSDAKAEKAKASKAKVEAPTA